MRQKLWQRTQAMIQTYHLHTTTPVKMWPLEDLYLIRYIDMAQMNALGAILPPPDGWPVSSQNRARVLIDHELGDTDARLVFAHEVGHGICQHVGELSSLALGLLERHEREAWEVASLLLIPSRVVHEEREIGRIAAVCNVPEWLVELWPSIGG